jgi:diaminopimelate decarboxylase
MRTRPSAERRAFLFGRREEVTVVGNPKGGRPWARGGSPWPAGAVFGPDGLSIGGVAAEELAARHGTPLMVYDATQVRERCRELGTRFPSALYAVKAFTARPVIRIAIEEGLGLLVASGGELAACLRAGADPARIAFHGNNKSDEELALAVEEGVGLVIADSHDELVRLDGLAVRAGATQPVLVRVTPGVTGGTHRYVETGEAGSKFGIPADEALDAVRFAEAAAGLRFRGLHAHVGSQLLRAEPVLEALEALLDLAERCRDVTGGSLEALDVGGGFGVTYTDELPLDLGDLAGALLARLGEACGRRGIEPPEVIVEPGRWVVANAGLTLYRIGTVKETGAGTLVAVDGGMSDNIRPALYGARHAVAPAGPPRAGSPVRAVVVGKHCESGDVIARDVELPHPPRRGDLLAVAATGAYSYSMASAYNRIGRPAVVGLRDGAAEPWLRREDDDDLDRLEVELAGERAR